MQNTRAFSLLFLDPVCKLTMSAYLMDLLLVKLRNAVMTAVNAALCPAPDLPLLAKYLGFSSTTEVSVFMAFHLVQFALDAAAQ